MFTIQLSIQKRATLSIIGLLVLLSVPLFVSSNQIGPSSVEASNRFLPADSIEYGPTSFAESVYDSKTRSFMDATRSISDNNASNVELIYFRLSTLKILDPSLSNLTSELKNHLISQLLSFQRNTGGFGHWHDDRSSVSSTHMALQSLVWLGYTGINSTLVKSYLDRLQNSLTNGYNSYLLDTDSDVHSTFLAIASYQLIGETPSNVAAVSDYLIRAQNPDGGFGLQTNNQKNIYWTSKVTVTQDAILGLDMLGSVADDPGAALDFVRGMQLLSDGGYANDLVTISSSSSYSAAALDTINFFADSPVNATSAAEYLYSLENPDGSFRLTPTSAEGSLKGTYFSVKALSDLGKNPTSILDTIYYLLHLPIVDGFGGTPGEDPSLRETFDAVYAYSLMGNVPDNLQGIIDYVSSYRNPDGGYGISGSFTESTLRAVEIYNLLGVAFPDSSTTISFLKSLQLPNGGFVKSSIDSTAYIVSTYRAIRALELLGDQPNDVPKAISFIQGIQNGDGGYGGYLGDTSDVTNTYRAISALSILSAMPTDTSEAISFLQNSQNPDGGFRRSVLDTALPNNISNTIYTYSAMRAMEIMGVNPLNLSGVYNFIQTVKNFDGGYAEHPEFTSDISYTFVSLYILRNFHLFSGFGMSIPDNLNSPRSQYENFTFSIAGYMGGFTYNITNTNASNSVVGVSPTSGPIVANTSDLVNGTYIFEITVEDGTGAIISTQFEVLIDRSPQTSTTTTQTSSSTQTSTNTGTDSNTNQTDSTGIPPSPLDPSMIFIMLGAVSAIVGIGAISYLRRK